MSAFLVFLAANFAAASTGAIFKPGAWYRQLSKPAWTPPDWLFPVAWFVLYITIAAAGWLIWRTGGGEPQATAALIVYGVQLVLNSAWSALFFGARRPDWGLVDVIALWLSIVAIIILAWPVSPLAAYLLLPYLAWVSFAAMLNAAIVNRQRKAPA